MEIRDVIDSTAQFPCSYIEGARVIVQDYRKCESSMIVIPGIELVKHIEIDAAAEKILSDSFELSWSEHYLL